MKTKINKITGLGMVLGLTALMALTPGQAGAHGGGGGGGGGHNGGGGGGGFYSTVSTVSELISDINYVNTNGGAFTINLAAGTTFNLKNVDNTTDGGNALPVIGGGVDLTIIGNGDTIARVTVLDRRFGYAKNLCRLFEVAPGASLTLEDLTLTNGEPSGDAGAVNNAGTLTIDNCTLSGNHTGGVGGAIDNVGGTVTINDSALSSNLASDARFEGGGGGIFNSGGTLTLNNSTLSGNLTSFGGAIFINGGTVMVNDSTLSDNEAYYNGLYGWGGGGGGIYNAAGTLTISGSIVTYNTASITGGGLFNDTGGTATVENYSSITGNNSSDDVDNLGALSTDGTCDLGIFDGNPYTPF